MVSGKVGESMIIGIVGEMASGKTTVSEILSRHGFNIIHADDVGHKIYEIGKPAYKRIIEYFGVNILNPDKTIDRKKLGEIVFNDLSKLKTLSQITHNDILKEIHSMVSSYNKSGQSKIVIDGALLYEAGIDKLCDEVWYIEDMHSRQIERIMNRDNLTEEQAKLRLAAQHNCYDITMHKTHADRVINNKGSIEELEKKIIELV